MALVVAPPAGRMGIKRLAHLPGAGRQNGALGLVKLKAGRLPVKTEKGDEPPAFAFEIRDQPLIVDRVHATPVVRETLDFRRAPCAIRKVLREGHRLAEVVEIARKTDVAQIPLAKD